MCRCPNLAAAVQASSRDKGGPGTSATAGLTAARTMLLMYKSSLTMDRGDFALVASANFVDAQTELLLRRCMQNMDREGTDT